MKQDKAQQLTKDESKSIRDSFVSNIVEVTGKHNHSVLVLSLPKSEVSIENTKGENIALKTMQVLRGRITFTDVNNKKLLLREINPISLKGVEESLITLASKQKNEALNNVCHNNSIDTPIASLKNQQKFIDEIKAAMGNLKMLVLPYFGIPKGVVAGTDEDKGVSLNRVYSWNDNISFAGYVPGDDLKKRCYYHPENISPNFYQYLVNEVKKAAAPQFITENGQKVTAANMFESPKEQGKYFFYARLDGIGLHPKVVQPDDVTAFMNKEVGVKEMFTKYYPTKMAKQLSNEEFDNLKLSNGKELTAFRIYKQRNEQKSNFGEYLLYAEMGQKRFHATPVSHDMLDVYFDKTQSKSQIAEHVIGEQLHLKSAYEKYKLSDNSIQEVRIRKTPNGDWLISANLQGEKGQTPERKLENNDLYALFKAKTATREQLAAKYLSEDIKDASRLKISTSVKNLKR